ncbi:C-C motif chemokine 20-like [Xiphophorus hellerii]|uniref:C-C motif chemokine 20-like n=1 Tax=Xiphophorus hellerii TaxID=8084 RepID=UPI0013B3E5B1|nr:C-C motif chemokine 20-like [Xiphophorus hellerii]
MVSMRVTVMAVTLVTVCVLVTNTHAGYVYCCRRYLPGRLPFSEIKGFSLQRKTALCPINAIIFHTRKDKRCVDPELEWVKDYVSQIETLAKKIPVQTKKIPVQMKKIPVQTKKIPVQMAGLPPDRTATDSATATDKQNQYVTEKVHQMAKPQQENSLPSVSNKIIEDGPLPMTLCKW